MRLLIESILAEAGVGGEQFLEVRRPVRRDRTLAALGWARAPPAAPLGLGPGSAAGPPLGAAAQGSSATPYGKGHWAPPPLHPVREPAGLCSRRPHCVLPPPSRQVSGVKLRELLVWQLITGYKLRELEAKEELNQLL